MKLGKALAVGFAEERPEQADDEAELPVEQREFTEVAAEEVPVSR